VIPWFGVNNLFFYFTTNDILKSKYKIHKNDIDIKKNKKYKKLSVKWMIKNTTKKVELV